MACVVLVRLDGSFSHDSAYRLAHIHVASMSCHSWHQFHIVHLQVAVLELYTQTSVSAET